LLGAIIYFLSARVTIARVRGSPSVFVVPRPAPRAEGFMDRLAAATAIGALSRPPLSPRSRPFPPPPPRPPPPIFPLPPPPPARPHPRPPRRARAPPNDFTSSIARARASRSPSLRVARSRSRSPPRRRAARHRGIITARVARTVSRARACVRSSVEALERIYFVVCVRCASRATVAGEGTRVRVARATPAATARVRAAPRGCDFAIDRARSRAHTVRRRFAARRRRDARTWRFERVERGRRRRARRSIADQRPRRVTDRRR